MFFNTLHLFSHVILLILREMRIADECQRCWYPSVYLSEHDMLRHSVCKCCTLLNTAVLCEMHVRERGEEEEVKTSTRTYGPHQTMPPQWGLKRLHAVRIKYSARITLPWLKVTVDNKRREQSWESATFQLINVSRRLKPRHYFISDSPLRRNFILVFAARLDIRYREQLVTNKILSARLFFMIEMEYIFLLGLKRGMHL